jgi:hypothetical protein
MHQMKRFDSQGNLIEVVTAQECTKSFWREFENITLQVHSEESLKNLAGLPIPPTKNRFKHENICNWCKNKFMGRRGQKYCPRRDYGFLAEKDQCHYKANLKKKELQRAALPPKACNLCGGFFNASLYHHKFCHNPCTPELARVKNKKPPTTYTCVLCEEKFQSRRPRRYAKYCHNPCNTRLMIKKGRILPDEVS